MFYSSQGVGEQYYYYYVYRKRNENLVNDAEMFLVTDEKNQKNHRKKSIGHEADTCKMNTWRKRQEDQDFKVVCGT